MPDVPEVSFLLVMFCSLFINFTQLTVLVIGAVTGPLSFFAYTPASDICGLA